MENPEQFEQEENLPPRPSSKRKYVLAAAIIVVIVGVGVLVVLTQKEVPSQAPSPTPIPITQEGETTLQGIVVENNLDCYMDGLCYLTFQTSGGEEVRVVYHYGEFPRCLNNLQGELLKKGEEVKVFGKVVGNNEVSTCDSLDYYIEKVGETEKGVNTSNWQTYRNEEFGFEVKYPLNSKVKELGDGVHIVLPFKKGLNKFLAIAIRDFENGDCPGNQSYYTTYEGIILSNGITFKRYSGATVLGGSMSEGYGYAVEKEGKCYLLIFALESESDEGDVKFLKETDRAREIQVFDQILSTFRFIEPIDISDWQTYRNDEFGFEFKAPSTMKLESQESEGFILSFENQKGTIGGHIEVRARILSVEEVQEIKEYIEDLRAADTGSEVPEGGRMIKVANKNLGNCVGAQAHFKNAYLVTECLKENLSVSVILVADLESAEEHKILYNEILPTFQFTE